MVRMGIMKMGCSLRWQPLGMVVACALAASGGRAVRAEGDVESASGMIFLHYADPRFQEGLRKHGLDGDGGLRFLNTGFDTRPFGERWASAPALADARRSGCYYYIDRITGGMPFQSLDGMGEILRELKDDPRFLGVQVHEWGNSPIHDYWRVKKLLLDKGLPFDKAHFAAYEKRTEPPYFSGGDYETYRALHRPLKNLADVEGYLEAYFRHLVMLTAGQIVSVNGHVQMHHTALRLGAKHVMAEIGNQVSLSALQIACARGAARQYGKPFGVYYETWGGSPFGCVCATDFSPWFSQTKRLKKVMAGYHVGPKFGSSRSLQRRLLFFAWLSGAAYCAEEWGPENYFSNWETHPLTDYGRVVKEFLTVSRRFGRLEPVVPAAIVTPPGTFGIDVNYVAKHRNAVFGIAPAGEFHSLLRTFATDLFATQPRRKGGDAHNLTPSPWIGCFDVLSAEARHDTLARYKLRIYFDRKQAERASAGAGQVLLYTGKADEIDRCVKVLRGSLPIRVEGQVGCAQARANGRHLLGIFNNLGITKTTEGEQADPQAARTATVHGATTRPDVLVGGENVTLPEDAKRPITVHLPAGALTVLSFPEVRSSS